MTAVKPVDGKLDVLAVERDVLEFWRQSGAFETLRKLRAGGPMYRFVDGPITANNPMGVHHAWGRTLKDAAIRYKAMQGHDCRYQNGFDCQGLWVEVETEKALGFSGKADIEKFGLDRFSRACRERVDTYARVISEQSARLGQWMDWQNSYFTYTDQNITGIWHFLRRCQERGWLRRQELPMPWCPRCGTSLSEHEMTGSYREVEHLAVFVRAPLLDGSNRALLVWTTTPWTLTANVAAAVNPELTYCEVPDGDQTLIVGKQVLRALRIKQRATREFKGSELVGLEYRTFFENLPAQLNVAHRVVAWEEVAAEEGSGIVHIAPGCGREDYELGQKLGLPIISPVDESGTYLADFGPFSGQNAAEVADFAAEQLRQSGRLYRAEPYTHSYPFCWRCKSELLFMLVGEWFICCDEVRPQMIACAETVAWQPDYIGKRMADWLQNMGDWCISRKRYWGLPLPFYPCRGCDRLTVVGSLAELKQLAVDPALVERLPELHRPWIDEVQISCPSCSAPVSRISEVGDCWLDAGIVPFSTQDYFTDRARWETLYPAEWICEMREQVRLWYYSMLFMGVVIEGRSPYQKVLSYERVVAEDGTKFSKTGHMIRFDDAVAEMGADPMRYVYCRQPVATECRFGPTVAQIAQRRLASLWNIYSFFVTYAAIDRPRCAAAAAADGIDLSDRWLRARTLQLLERCTASYEGYDTPAVLREVEAFVDDLSNWYVRINRRRFWRSGKDADKEACYSALYAALRTVVTVLAPIVPFISESIWQNAVRGIDAEAPQSVHHARWPRVEPTHRDDALLAQTAIVREVISVALRLREDAGARVRQPLARLMVLGSAEVVAALQSHRTVLCAQVNLKRIEYIESKASYQLPAVELNFAKAGPVLKKGAGQVKAALQTCTVEQMAELAQRHARGQALVVPGVTLSEAAQGLSAELFRRADVPDPRYKVSDGKGFTLALDTELDEALVAEGLARDATRKIQIMRREAGFSVTERVRAVLSSEDPILSAAIAAHRETIADEILARELFTGASERVADTAADVVQTTQIQGKDLSVRLWRLIAS